jgi:hypothetical protein
MRMRPIAAAVVLGLGIVGIALAQQANQQPGQPAATRAKLRSRIVKLRAELDLLQLEHDTDRADLLDDMRTQRQKDNLLTLDSLETLATAREPMKMPKSEADWEAIGKRVESGDQDAMQLLAVYERAASVLQASGKVLKEEETLKAAEAAAKEFLEKKAKLGESLRSRVDRNKQDYARQAASLAEKRLDLEDLERQYHGAR